MAHIPGTTVIFGPPSGGGFSEAAKPPPGTKIPKITDPEIIEARKLAKRRAKLRKGRGSTILTSGRGVEDQLGSVGRPVARAATLLG